MNVNLLFNGKVDNDQRVRLLRVEGKGMLRIIFTVFVFM
jgi:hypothetical protein